MMMRRRGSTCFRRKTLAEFSNDDEESDRSLSLFDLLCIGIGGTVGSGVFVLTGEVYPVAGPASALCWMVGALVCLLSALSYMELSALVPTKGSTYAYSYYALGEFAAVAGATSLTLEYGLSGAGVARSWSVKVFALFWDSPPPFLTIPYASEPDYSLDVCAALLQFLCFLICYRGFNLSKKVVNWMTVLKVALVFFLIVAGFAAGTLTNVFEDADAFFPRGASGVASGTSLLFFGFIGFDEVCCMAARSRNPRRNIPRAIAGTLLGAAALSTLAQLALAGLVAADSDSSSDSATTSFEKAFRERGWVWAKYVAQIGEVLLLPLVVLLSFMPQPELMAALGQDRVVSERFAKQRNGVYDFGCKACGAALVTVTFVVPFDILWNVINLGVLLGFNVSNASLISVRLGNGGAQTNAPASARLTLFAGLLAPLSAYVLWKGAIGPLIDHGSSTDARAIACLVAGLLAFSVGCLVLLRLARDINSTRRPPPLSDDDIVQEDGGRALVFGGGAGNDEEARDSRLLEITADEAATRASDSSSPKRFPGKRAQDELFRAPGVPFVPGAAIFLNFLLMAQYAWIDHAYLLALYATAYAGYACAKCDRAPPDKRLESPTATDDDGVPALDRPLLGS